MNKKMLIAVISGALLISMVATTGAIESEAVSVETHQVKENKIALPGKIIDIFPSEELAQELVKTFDKNSIEDIITQEDIDKTDRLWFNSPKLTDQDMLLLDNVLFKNVSTFRYYGSQNKQLTHLPDLSSLPNVESLVFSNANSFVRSDIPNYKNYPKLISMEFKGGLLLTIPDFTNLPSLKFLDLSYNRIGRVEGNVIPNFSHLPNLEQLNLAYNDLEQVPDFTNLPNINTLNVSGNSLTQLPQTILNNPKAELYWIPQNYTYPVQMVQYGQNALGELPIYFQLVEAGKLEKSKIDIYDLNGNPVIKDLPVKTKEQRIVLPTEQLQRGAYYVIVRINSYLSNPDFVHQYVYPVILQ